MATGKVACVIWSCTAMRKQLSEMLTPEFILGFKDFLESVEKDTHQTQGAAQRTWCVSRSVSNSKASYFRKLSACINHAYDERIIAVNPLRGIEGFKDAEVKRDYLTLEEVRKLAETPCRYPVLKRAFLFSCLTGLRKSDIQKLLWGDVQKFGEFTRIIFKQKKTGGQEYLDISPQAEKYLGERGNPEDPVFTGFTYGSWTSVELQRWSMTAGIKKNLHSIAGAIPSQSWCSTWARTSILYQNCSGTKNFPRHKYMPRFLIRTSRTQYHLFRKSVNSIWFMTRQDFVIK